MFLKEVREVGEKPWKVIAAQLRGDHHMLAEFGRRGGKVKAANRKKQIEILKDYQEILDLQVADRIAEEFAEQFKHYIVLDGDALPPEDEPLTCD